MADRTTRNFKVSCKDSKGNRCYLNQTCDEFVSTTDAGRFTQQEAIKVCRTSPKEFNAQLVTIR
jgi:hypothetical protein